MKLVNIDRQSVCMGDDCTAPNEDVIGISKTDTLLTVFDKIVSYLPHMQNVIWAVDTGKKLLGYVISEADKHCFYDICVGNQALHVMDLDYLHCSYFHANSFMPQHDKPVDLKGDDPSCQTLLDKVKRHMGERFLQELNVKGGSICIWGEWFGRPQDNYHVIKTIQWRTDELVLHFMNGEALYIQKPIVIKNEINGLIVQQASEILWTWYDSSEHTDDQICIRRYRKDSKGVILRAEGKRRAIHDEDGVPFVPLSENALVIA